MDRRDFIKKTLTLAALMPLAKLDAGSAFVSTSAKNISADLLFTNVELYDGTGTAPFMADVAVKDDKIVQVAACGTLNRTGCTVVDGHGKALVPGFIDVHTHSDSAIYRTPAADSKLMQGVTTDISGNCGTSHYLLGSNDLKSVRGNFRAYLDMIEKAKPAVNVAHLCGHNSLRRNVMGFENRPPTREENCWQTHFPTVPPVFLPASTIFRASLQPPMRSKNFPLSSKEPASRMSLTYAVKATL